MRFGPRTVFSKLFASVILALVLFAGGMITLTHLVHDNSANTRWQVLAKQITNQIDPLLQNLSEDMNDNNQLQARFTLAVIKKSFDIFDESLQAHLGLYDANGRLLVQTDGSDLPHHLPKEQSWLATMLPSFSKEPSDNSVQAVSKHGFTLLYQSRQPPVRSELASAFNLLTGTILLLIIMTIMLWWMAHSMTWRLNRLSQQMTQLGEGDFSARVPAQGNDEIASLAQGFNQAAQKIEQLINANNLLLAHASHELRTPITRIRLQVEMMDMLASALPEETKQKFDKRATAINRDLNGLNDLVESILLVSRLDAGHAAQQIERFDLYELVHQESQHYEEARLIGEHVIMQGQPKLLIHLIRNLLNNALIHGEPPITVQLYGVMTVADAYTPPNYLIENVIADDSQSIKDLGQTNDSAHLTGAHSADAPIAQGVIAKQDNKIIDGSTLTNDVSNDSNTTNANTSENTLPHNTLSHRDKETEQAKSDSQLVASDTISNDIDSSLNNKTMLSTNTPLSVSHVKQDSLVNETALTSIIPPTKNDKIDKAKSMLLNELTDNRFAKRLRRPKADPIAEIPNYAVLAVIDQGSGIPEDKRNDIFSPFVRLQQKKKGSGLGLSLVAQIVEAHHGHISTDTIDGKTRFIVVLPTKFNSNFNHNASAHNKDDTTNK